MFQGLSIKVVTIILLQLKMFLPLILVTIVLDLSVHSIKIIKIVLMEKKVQARRK